jgi:O-antigen/teichoic acid export membrane protein
MKNILQHNASKKTLVGNIGWMFLGKCASIVLQALYFMLLGRLLGVTEYGIFVGVASLVALVSQYSTMGAQTVFLRHVCPDLKLFHRYWGNIIMTTLSLGTTFVACFALLSLCGWIRFSPQILICIALSDCICAQFTTASVSVFQAFEEMRYTAAVNILTNALRVLLAGLMLWKIKHATAGQWAIAVMLVSVVAVLTSVTIITKKFGRPVFSPLLLKQRIGEGFVFALSYSTGAIYNDIDKAMLGHYGMNVANGIYTMAYRVIDVATVPFYSIQAAVFPRFFQKGAVGLSETVEFAKKIVSRSILVALVCTVAAYLCAPLVPMLVGKGFSESIVAIRWLCLIPVFRSLHISGGDALTSSGHQLFRLGAQIAVSIFNAMANLYLIPHNGWLGAAWASLATDGLLVLLNWSALFYLNAQHNNAAAA